MNILQTPDDWHLQTEHHLNEIKLDYDLFLKFLRYNHYPPPNLERKLSVIAVRGCAAFENAAPTEELHSAYVTSCSPNFRQMRCLIAVVNHCNRKFKLFRGSTLPSWESISAFIKSLREGVDGRSVNYLPHGRYLYTRGNHYGPRGRVPGILRQGYGPRPKQALKVTVLRPNKDPWDVRAGTWDLCKPKDNLHPAGEGPLYSSEGCITISGWYDREHHGEYAIFSAYLDYFAKDQHHFDLYVSSMAELNFVVQEDAKSDGAWCLRHGSYGLQVSALNHTLGLAPKRFFGAETKFQLIKRQWELGLYQSGTLSRRQLVLL